eukprot:scaffold22113_cov64-Phaeocystis_antarctica.AAC.5
MCEPCTPDALLEAVRGLRIAEPDLGFKPLLAKLREQQPDLGAGTREVREALNALKAESEAKAVVMPPAANEVWWWQRAAQRAGRLVMPPAVPHAATAVPPAADKGGAPPNVALSLACFGCARLPSDMDDEREKHPVCPKCVKLKVPTTYWCCVDCLGNPGAWKLHAAYHKEVKKTRQRVEDGGAMRQRDRELAEEQGRHASQTGDKYDELLAEGIQYGSKDDTRRAARTFREAIALKPDAPVAYCNLGNALKRSGHKVEAAQRFLEAKERYPVGSEYWGDATAMAFEMLRQKQCDEVAKPEWWNDEGLKVLSARVARAAPNAHGAHLMRGMVLSGQCDAWEVGPRSAAELMEAAAHFDRAAALSNAPAIKASFANNAEYCRDLADEM